jgi:hypothetical protein
VRFHDIRHTRITELGHALKNPLQVAAISGHDDLGVLKRYFNATAEDLATVLNRLEGERDAVTRIEPGTDYSVAVDALAALPEQEALMAFMEATRRRNACAFAHRATGTGELDSTSRLVYISDGINRTDAMNMRQGSRIASWYGGGVDYLKAIVPTFALSGGTFSDVNRALLYLDGKNTGGGGVGPQWPKGDTGPQGPASGHDDLAVHYDDSTQQSVTLGGSGGTAIHNVRALETDTDAVNVGQLNRSARDTFSQANAYADAGDAANRDWAKAYTDSRLTPLSRRINQAGAVGSVIGGMALSAGSVQQQDKLSMGAASFRGQSAIGIGYVHRFDNDRVAVAVGVAIAGEGSTLAVSVSIGLNH